jgi:IS30 family transposase
MIQMQIYQHLSPEERASIMLMFAQQCSIRFIAKHLNRSPSTISREIKRNHRSSHLITQSYCATTASKRYFNQRQCSVKPRKIQSSSILCYKIESWLTDEKWSPEQISGTLKLQYPNESKMQVSPETVYAYIYAYPKGELKKLMIQSLRRKKSKRGPRGSVDSCYSSLKIEESQRIENRPNEIDGRKVAGHWEGDLIVGAKNKSCVGTLVERKTGFVILNKMKSKSALNVREGLELNMKNVPAFLRLSLTYDRGAEMAQHPLLSKNLKLSTYFADPHSPWQRGSNENINGLIRQFLPKGEDLSGYSQIELDHIGWLLNGRPRKRFGFRTPLDMMETELEGGLMRVALDS